VAASGEPSAATALEAARGELERVGIEPEYLEARDPDTLATVESLNGRPVLIALAARVGSARLIDNTLIGG
jgi:pantoate--beta-alanine ligase